MTPNDYPNPPGHPHSVADGCRCPVLDNAHGKGCGYLAPDGSPLYIFSEACPLHGGSEGLPSDTAFPRDLSEPAYGAAARLKEKIA